MILQLDQIKHILLNNPNKDIVDKGSKYNKLLRMHLYGEGLKDHLELIDGFEASFLKTLRGKYAKSNKDLFSRLGRPIDKVFSARGGSVYYNLADTQEKKARQLAGDVHNGLSIRKWIETIWKAHMLDDPFGMVFLEIPSKIEALRLKQQGKSIVYPTYKSITTVYDMLPKGSGLDYVVFKVDNKEKGEYGYQESDLIYRVVDDAFDYLIKREGDQISILKETFPNYFGQVPAIINSDIVNPMDDNCFLSLFDEVIELANQFLLKGSIKVTHDFLHGFPKYWEYADDCTKCGGSKYVDSEKCSECKGTGKRIMTKVSDAKLLNYPSDKDAPLIAPNVAGYVAPEKIFYEIATADLQALEDLMNLTIWGKQPKVASQPMTANKDGQTKTATEVMDDIKPEADRLTIISEMAEKRHKFILDAVIRLQISLNYQGSSVNYGRRYMIESPDKIWEKYSDARTKGSPISVLDDLLTEYYEAKYVSDPVSLAISLKLMYVEPFVHYKIGEVQAFNTDPLDYKAKLYFSEWLAEQNDATLLSSDVVVLKEALQTYSSNKNVVTEQQLKLPAA